MLTNAAAQFKQAYDPRNGGFGDAPKFPQPSQPALLLRYGTRFKDAEAVRMVLHTCDRMAAGGIHDQLGGGFARYSVDAEWLVPHFEKMLYDNAQLVNLYLDAYLVSGEARHADTARDIIALRSARHDPSRRADFIPPKTPTAKARKASFIAGRGRNCQSC